MGPVKKLGVAVEEVYEIEHGLAVLPKMMILQKGIRSWMYFCIVNIKVKIRPRKECMSKFTFILILVYTTGEQK